MGYLNEIFEPDEDCSSKAQNPTEPSSEKCQSETAGATKNKSVLIETDHAAESRTATEERRKSRTGHNVKSKTVTDSDLGKNDIALSDKSIEKSCPSSEEKEAPEGGWGYVVVLGAFMIMFINGLVTMCFGILFTDYLLEESASLTTTTALISEMTSISNVAFLIGGTLKEWWGWRRVVMLGAMLSSSGMAMTAFTPSVNFMFFSYSLLTAFGCGLCTIVALSIPSFYFKRKRGKACAIAQCGTNVGTVAGPPLVSYLQLEYGFRGATLITAAITLHLCFSATVFHPVEWHVTGGKNTKTNASNKPSKTQTIRNTFSNFLRLLKFTRTYIIALAVSCVIGMMRTGLSFIPLVLERRGYTPQDAAFATSIVGMCGFVGRILTPSLTDTAWFSARMGYIGCLIITIVALIVFSLVETLMWITVAMSFFGIGISGCYGLISLVIIHYMGLNNLMHTLGICGLSTAVLMPSINPLYGVFERLSGGYSGPILFLSSQACLAMVLWLLMPLAEAFDKKRMTSNKESSTPSAG